MSPRFHTLLLVVLALSTGSLWACEGRSAAKNDPASGCAATCGMNAGEQVDAVTDRIVVPAAGPLTVADEITEDMSSEMRHIAIEESSGYLQQDASN
jgi:hypothetical protein